MTLAEAVAALAAHDNAEEAVAALKDKAGALYHAVFQAGHDVATGRKAKVVESLNDRVTALTTELNEVQVKLRAAEAKTPELAQVHDQYKQQIADLTAEHERVVAEANGKLEAERLSHNTEALRAELIGSGVDPDYAEVLVAKPSTRDRFAKGPDGEPVILQPGKTVPFAAAGDLTPLKLLAKALLVAVPPKFLVSNVDRGAGRSNQGSGEAAGTSVYDRIREEVRKGSADQRSDRDAALALVTGVADK